MAHQASPLELLRSHTMSGLVQEEILRRIKVGELESGAKLNEVDLSEEMQVSRSPVREAFRALEEAGLVRMEKNRGAFIREISDAEAAELYEVRGGLDEMCGRLLAPVITDRQLQELSRSLDALEATSLRGVNKYFPLNIAFHDRLVEMSGNKTLLLMYRQVINRMHLLRRRGFLLAGAGAASHAEHRGIVTALAQRDPVAAMRAMGEHVRGGFARTVGAAIKQAGVPLEPR